MSSLKTQLFVLIDLKQVYEQTSVSPFVQSEIVLKNVDNQEDGKENYHQAGYDSYITGCCFINLVQYLNAQAFPKVESFFSDQVIGKHRNKVAIGRSYDIKFIDLERPDVVSPRKHFFHVTYPNTWSRHDICQMFEKYGGLTYVKFIDDVSSIVVLNASENYPDVISDLIDSNESNVIKVVQTF